MEVTDREAAKTAVVDELSHKQRKRLVVRELPGRVKATAVPQFEPAQAARRAGARIKRPDR